MIPFLKVNLPKRASLFAALRSQCGQWDPLDEGPRVPGRCFVEGLLSDGALGSGMSSSAD